MKLYAHQERLRADLLAHGRWFGDADPGTGKTIASLSACAERNLRSVVLAPKTVLRTAWLRDSQHFPSLRVVVLDSDVKPAKRIDMIHSKWDLCVTNYDMFRKYVREFWKAGTQRLIVDEAAKIRNHTAKITQSCIWFGDAVKEVWLLSGCIAPNHQAEYWAPLRVMDKRVSGPSYYGFEARYTVPIKKRIWINGQMREVTTGHHHTDAQRAALVELLKTCSTTIRREDCLDLPSDQTIVVPVKLDDEVSAYMSCSESLRIEMGSQSFSVNGSASLMKLRQITGGVVRLEGVPRIVGTSKLEALADLLDSLGSEPVVIAAEFNATIDAIESMCKERGESVRTIDGRTSDKAADTVAAFQRGEVSRCIIHPASAGHGITLVAAKYMIFYETSFSYEQHMQAKARILRIGQDRPVTYYVLLAECEGEDTVDHAAYRVCTRKGNAVDALRSLLSGKDADAVVT